MMYSYYMNELIFLDTETTGNDLMKDRLSQVCYKTTEGFFTGYFKPPIPMSIKAMSITNITNKMLHNKERFGDSIMKKNLEQLLSEKILVAHNAKFDCAMLEAEGLSVPRRICTLRVARYLDPDNLIPEYNLSYLRYYFDIDVEANAHDAEGDVIVLCAIFDRLFAKMKAEIKSDKDIIAKMIDISSRPTLFKLFSFGKYKDKKIEEVAKSDRRYLEWMLNQKLDSGTEEEDWIHTLKYYLNNN